MSTRTRGPARSPRGRAVWTSPAPESGRSGSGRLQSTKESLRGVRLPDGSRSATSPWVWRGMLFMSLIALGLCLRFSVGQQVVLAVAWAIITAGWFAISMWLWRRHLQVQS